MFQNKLNYTIINLAAFMLFLYIGLSNIGLWGRIISKGVSVLSPFLIGFVFAYAFTPLVRYLVRKGIPRSIAIIIIIIGLFLLVGGILYFTLPMLYEQISLLINTLMDVFQSFSDKFHINIGSFEIKVTDYLNDALKEIGSITSSTTVILLGNTFDFLSKFIVGFVGFVYFLVDMDKIRFSIKKVLFRKNRRFFEYLKCMDLEITNYLKGLEIFMVIQLFEYSFLFLLVGHPNWFILGLLACLTTVIPYFGGLITNLIAIVLASVVSFKLMVATTIICLIFPQLDGYLISPKVYGKTNNVNPLITIMVVSVGGTLLGLPGIVIALPCYLLIRTTYHFYQKDLKKGMDIVKDTI